MSFVEPYCRKNVYVSACVHPLFGDGMKPIALTEACRLKMRTELAERLFTKSTLAPPKNTDEATNNFKKIEYIHFQNLD